MDAIQTFQLTKKYKDTLAVDALTLSVPHGELFALLGVNGAGKTTTIRMLCGLVRPTSGDALLNGHSILTDLAGVKREIGVSPQETAVAPNLTVLENLSLLCGAYGLSSEQKNERIHTLTQQFHLESILKKRAGKLSGGWMRRLSIAMALVGSPKILFLDEPSLGLDVLARSELWNTIRALKGSVTIILTTHYMEEAEELSDRIGIMKSGRLLALGSPSELKEVSSCPTLEKAFLSYVKEAV